MEELLRRWGDHIALGVEVIAALLILVGAFEAILMTVRQLLGSGATLVASKKVWLGLARWLMLALEFELAADILRSAIAPSWNSIARLGAIAAIRTFLNYYLEQDVEQFTQRQKDVEAGQEPDVNAVGAEARPVSSSV
jgi:uncharacterized membrane protein